MAYSPATPPVLKSHGPIAGAPQTWSYTSADAKATVAAANYFTNALALGFKPGDIVEAIVTGTFTISLHRVTAVTSSGATLSAGLDIT